MEMCEMQMEDFSFLLKNVSLEIIMSIYPLTQDIDAKYTNYLRY